LGAKKKPSLDELEKRLKHIETLLEGVSITEDKWSLAEIQEIIDHTDFTTDMENLPLTEMARQSEEIKKHLDIAEGNILNLQMSHRGHTNYNPVEFANMHGYRIESLKTPHDLQPASKRDTPDTLQSLRSELQRCREALAKALQTECAQCHEKKPVVVKVGELGKEKWVCIKCLKEIW